MGNDKESAQMSKVRRTKLSKAENSQLKKKEKKKTPQPTSKSKKCMKPYRCDQCEISFADKYVVALHKEIHKDPAKRNVFNCKYCGVPFLREGDVNRHLIIVHPNKIAF